jgi:hypothetical protein
MLKTAPYFRHRLIQAGDVHSKLSSRTTGLDCTLPRLDAIGLSEVQEDTIFLNDEWNRDIYPLMDTFAASHSPKFDENANARSSSGFMRDDCWSCSMDNKSYKNCVDSPYEISKQGPASSRAFKSSAFSTETEKSLHPSDFHPRSANIKYSSRSDSRVKRDLSPETPHRTSSLMASVTVFLYLNFHLDISKYFRSSLVSPSQPSGTTR